MAMAANPAATPVLAAVQYQSEAPCRAARFSSTKVPAQAPALSDMMRPQRGAPCEFASSGLPSMAPLRTALSVVCASQKLAAHPAAQVTFRIQLRCGLGAGSAA